MARRLAAALLLSAVALPTGGQAADPSAARQGELLNLLRHDCGSCHGLTLKGGLGPALLPARLTGFPSEALAEAILDGRPETPMPPWRGLLSEPEVRWMVRQLKKGLPE